LILAIWNFAHESLKSAGGPISRAAGRYAGSAGHLATEWLFSLPADPGPEGDQDRKADRDWKADSARASAPVWYRAASAAYRHCPDSAAAADLGGQAVESPAAGAWGAAGADEAAESGAPAAAGGVAGVDAA